jgi:putative mRNA 3-end processing factor
MDLIAQTPEGLYCAAGDFHIDPLRPVARAVITHAHSDHARYGSELYLCHKDTAPILRKRLGDIRIETLDFGESVTRGDVALSLHPAGHVLGSAQVRLESRGEVWVASGDYKTEDDGICAAFAPIGCNAFITESTFGLPIYRWRPQAELFADINLWWRNNAAAGQASVLFAYSLGKAQRILRYLDASIGPILCHGAIEPINQVYRDAGVALPATRGVLAADKAEIARSIVLAPPSASGTPWMRRFGNYSDGYASGWMQVRGNRRRRGVNQGFVVSDHADWPGLIEAIAATGAERIYATHGSVGALTRYLSEKGLDARALPTGYGGEDEDVATADAEA